MRLTYGKKTEGDSANKLADADGAGHVAVIKVDRLSQRFDEDNRIWNELSRRFTSTMQRKDGSFSVTSRTACALANQRAAVLHRNERGVYMLFLQ